MTTQSEAGFHRETDCRVADMEALIDRRMTKADAPQSVAVEKNVPFYDMAMLGGQLAEQEGRDSLMAEWASVLRHSAGVLVLKGVYADTAPVDAATEVFNRIIAMEKAASQGGGDHFAVDGANDRIWNSLQKLCFAAPEIFALYFGNVAIAAVCEAWLGPNYQMTAQVNLVRPGGAAQLAHRDYHLGFQDADTCARYPAHVHELSAALTLQGGIAHCDMTVESGPTKLLPFSQLYLQGYAAWRRDDFRALFEDRYVQLPLQKGDAVFFNPAMFHAAGANQSKDVQRMVNLLQVSSAFGRAMESVDRAGMVRALFPALKGGGLGPAQADAAIAAAAEGYSFPTNLDQDPPKGGLAPQTQAALMRQALTEGWEAPRFSEALDAQIARQRP